MPKANSEVRDEPPPRPLSLAIAAFTLGLTACGGGSGGSNPPPVITVTLSGQPVLPYDKRNCIHHSHCKHRHRRHLVMRASVILRVFQPNFHGQRNRHDLHRTFDADDCHDYSDSYRQPSQSSASIIITAPSISVALNPAPPLP